MTSEPVRFNVHPLREVEEPWKLPERKHGHDAGYDLYLPEQIVLTPKPTMFKLGFAMSIPPGYEAQIRPRSSSALRGVFIQHGTIDCNYRGEVGFVAWSMFHRLRLDAGDRVAQLVIAPIANSFIQVCDSLDETDRGEGGFGSTG